MNPENRAGQHVDMLKHHVVVPAVAETILQIPKLPKKIALLDVGSGDGSSVAEIIEHLDRVGTSVRKVAMLDPDIGIFPDLIDTALDLTAIRRDVNVVHSKDLEVLDTFIGKDKKKYDVAVAQLVLHQIKHISEVTFLLRHVFHLLKDDGQLILVNLHQKYLNYLDEHERDKFSYSGETGEGQEGTYYFDSGSNKSIYMRDILTLGLALSSMGFAKGVEGRRLFTDVVADVHPRYKKLSEEKVPMFGISPLKKEQKRLLGEAQGVVKSIKQYRKGWLEISFGGSTTIKMPEFEGWQDVKPRETLFITKTAMPQSPFDRKARNIFTYWHVNDEGEIRSEQLGGIKI